MGHIKLRIMFCLLTGLSAVASTFSLSCAQEAIAIGSKDQAIMVNNRVVAILNGKAISIIDVMKKMDMIFYRQYPEYAESIEARHHFYSSHWKQVLSEMIDRELVLADAEEKQLAVSPGDVRQELEDFFGPNVMLNLDSAGLDYDEAWQMIRSDIIIRRMLYFQVNSKVYQMVNPKEIRKAYEKHIDSLSGTDQIKYQIISVKSDDLNASKDAVRHIYDLLVTEKISVEEIEGKRDQLLSGNASVHINVSQEYTQEIKDLAESLRENLWAMDVGAFSEPQLVKSRTAQKDSWRIYHLKEKIIKMLPSFMEMEQQLKDEMIQELVAIETENYFKKLRAHFKVEKELIESQIPRNFQPFILRHS